MARSDTDGIVLGVDVGTTQTKAVATSPQGEVLAIGTCRTRWQPRDDGGAEIGPDVLLDGVLTAARAAVDDVATARGGRPPAVAGLGVTGMAEAGVLLEAPGRPSAVPIIAWFDPRGTDELATLDPAFRAAFPARTGLPVSPVATFAKLLWLRRQHDVDLGGKVWLNVPEYVVHALGGEATTEPSLASRTGLLDQDDLRPFPDALDVVGATASLLPPVVAAGTALGRAAGAQPEWLRGAVVTVAGHDHPVASLAAGALGPDDLFDSCGTAEALLRVTERRISPDERVALSAHNVSQGAHVLPGRRALLGGTRGGLLLRRVLAMLGADSPEARAALDAACPIGDVRLPVEVEGGRLDEQAVRIRIDSDEVSPAWLWRAALDAVTDQARGLVEIFEEVTGPASRMIAAGGWTRAASYRAIKRRAFPGIEFADVEQAGALGAAAVAAFAASGEGPIERLPDAVQRFMSR